VQSRSFEHERGLMGANDRQRGTPPLDGLTDVVADTHVRVDSPLRCGAALSCRNSHQLLPHLYFRYLRDTAPRSRATPVQRPRL